MHWFSQPIMSHRSRSAGSIRADAVRPCKVQRSGRERVEFSNQWLSIASKGAIAHNIIHRKKKYTFQYLFAVSFGFRLAFDNLEALHLLWIKNF